MYIRVKRKNTTIFLEVHPDDTIYEVKRKLIDSDPENEAMHNPSQIRLYHSDREKLLENDATVGDQEILNDHVVYMVLEIREGTFESIDVPQEVDAGKFGEPVAAGGGGGPAP